MRRSLTVLLLVVTLLVTVFCMPPNAERATLLDSAETEVYVAQWGGGWGWLWALIQQWFNPQPPAPEPEPDPDPPTDPPTDPPPDPPTDPPPPTDIVRPTNAIAWEDFRDGRIDSGMYDLILSNYTYRNGQGGGSMTERINRHPSSNFQWQADGLRIGVNRNEPGVRVDDGAGRDRCELQRYRVDNTNESAPGRNTSYIWYVKFPENFPQYNGYCIFAQILQTNGRSGPPTYALEIDEQGRLQFNLRPQNVNASSPTATRTFGKINDGKVHKFEIYVEWRVGSGGRGSLYLDDQHLHTYTAVNAERSDVRHHPKHGWYRGFNIQSSMQAVHVAAGITNGRPQYPRTALQEGVDGVVDTLTTPIRTVREIVE